MRPSLAASAIIGLLVIAVGDAGSVGAATLHLGPGEIVRAGGANLTVPGYAVPALADWNNDGLFDLIIGEGGNHALGRIRVYLNEGAAGSPAFSSFSYVRSGHGDLDANPCGCGCLGVFPRVVDFNGDRKKDLLVGQTYGEVRVYLNEGTDGNPVFGDSVPVMAGPAGGKAPIDVGDRATIALADWDNNGARDLVLGALDGRIHLYLNQGTDAAPDFAAETLVAAGAGYLEAPSLRSSPVVMDLDGDGRKDLLVGNTDGQILLYSNEGTDAAPSFSTYSAVTAGGVPIDLAGDYRARPAIVDWTGDGRPDLLVGYGGFGMQGTLYLFQSVPEPGALALAASGLAMGLAVLVRRRRSV
ncbi:MAG: VCBS repeat-containing protein [Pirellulales bacterium]|nr:VCBS repeat-containing protein [Pirellulales bacterium]